MCRGDQVGDDFFVRRAQGQVHLPVLPRCTLNWISTLPNASTRPVRSHRSIGVQGRHEQFDRPGAVHFLADDPLGLAQRPQPQRQVGVGPGHQLADQPGAQHQHVAGDLRPFGRFLHRRE